MYSLLCNKSNLNMSQAIEVTPKAKIDTIRQSEDEEEEEEEEEEKFEKFYDLLQQVSNQFATL